MKRHINPPFYFMLFLLMIVLVYYTVPLPRLIHPPLSYLGILGIAFGTVVNIWADAVFKRQNTTVKPYYRPSALVTAGPYRISRNPMYLGMFAILFGEAVLFGTLAVLLMPFIFTVLMQYIFIRSEEKNMEKAFGEKYLTYRKRTRRWA